MASGEAFGNPDAAVSVACAVELAHGASLLLDDLPSMDDASHRRGRPCAHLIFPCWSVDMAGVYLINLAYEVLLQNPYAGDSDRLRCAAASARTANRMLAGQEADLQAPSESDASGESILQACRDKTGSLFGFAAQGAALACGANDAETEAICQAGTELGLAYQIEDDLADLDGDGDRLGKPTGQDGEKATTATWWSRDQVSALAAELREKATSHLEPFGERAERFRQLIRTATVFLNSNSTAS